MTSSRESDTSDDGRGGDSTVRERAGLLVVRPDFERRITLAGVGPCPRPVDIDRTRIGLSKLVSLRVYAFAQDMVIDGEAEGDEVFIVLMRGRADIAVDRSGSRVGEFSLGTDGGLRVVYLPPLAAYRLTAQSDCDIAYARVQPPGTERPEARGFAPDGQRRDVSGYAKGMDLALATLAAGETLALVDRDGGSPERFVHIRSDDDGAGSVSRERLGDWDSAVLGEGERATLEVEKGTIEILTISASAR